MHKRVKKLGLIHATGHCTVLKLCESTGYAGFYNSSPMEALTFLHSHAVYHCYCSATREQGFSSSVLSLVKNNS